MAFSRLIILASTLAVVLAQVPLPGTIGLYYTHPSFSHISTNQRLSLLESGAIADQVNCTNPAVENAAPLTFGDNVIQMTSVSCDTIDASTGAIQKRGEPSLWSFWYFPPFCFFCGKCRPAPPPPPPAPIRNVCGTTCEWIRLT